VSSGMTCITSAVGGIHDTPESNVLVYCSRLNSFISFNTPFQLLAINDQSMFSPLSN